MDIGAAVRRRERAAVCLGYHAVHAVYVHGSANQGASCVRLCGTCKRTASGKAWHSTGNKYLHVRRLTHKVCITSSQARPSQRAAPTPTVLLLRMHVLPPSSRRRSTPGNLHHPNVHAIPTSKHPTGGPCSRRLLHALHLHEPRATPRPIFGTERYDETGADHEHVTTVPSKRSKLA